MDELTPGEIFDQQPPDEKLDWFFVEDLTKRIRRLCEQHKRSRMEIQEAIWGDIVKLKMARDVLLEQFAEAHPDSILAFSPLLDK